MSTFTQAITNDIYRATADGNLWAVGQEPVVTFVGYLHASVSLPPAAFYWQGTGVCEMVVPEDGDYMTPASAIAV